MTAVTASQDGTISSDRSSEGAMDMKVFISTDLEGVSGIVSWQQVLPEGGEYYAAARRLLTADVNAAIEGAVEAGADEILVDDCHGAFLNILYDELHPAADIVRGTNEGHRPRYLMEGLDDTFDLVFMVGAHAQAQDWPGILSHTYTERVKEVSFNGVAVSEARMGAALAGAIGVPMGMVSGDDRICKVLLHGRRKGVNHQTIDHVQENRL